MASSLRDEVARKAGVSASSVSRALADHPGIPEATRERVRRAAKELGYVPSRLGLAHFSKRSFRVGLVAPFSTAPGGRTVMPEYFSKTALGLVEALRRESFTLNVLADEGRLDADALEREVRSHSVDGLVFLALRDEDPRPLQLSKRKIPFVTCHHPDADSRWLSVDIDNASGLDQISAHLRERGVRDVAWIAGDEGAADGRLRSQLVPAAFEKAGLRMSVSLPGGFSRRGGRAATKKLLENRKLPQAIVCASDRMAFGVIEELRAAGLRIPEDVRVTGFDNVEVATLIQPALTTVDNPFIRIGDRAGELLLRAIRGETVDSAVFPAELVVRQST